MSNDRKGVAAVIKAYLAPAGEPPPEDWQIAPILDRFKWVLANDGSLRVEGRLVGRNEAAPDLLTGPVLAADSEVPRPRWVATHGGVYRLGGPMTTVSPLLEIAGARDWASAIEVARVHTGFHTLPALMQHNELRVSDDAITWAERRRAARLVAESLGFDDRDEAESLWQILAANPRDVGDARIVRNLLMSDPSIEADPTTARVLEAWTWLADPHRVGPPSLDAFAADGEFDAFKAAHDIGAALADAREADEAALRRPHVVPGYVKVALSKSLLGAWEVARDYVSGELAALVHRSNFRKVAGEHSFRVMRDIAATAGDASRPIFDLLATNPADRREVERVVAALERMTYTREGQLAFDRWHQLLTAAVIGNPVASQHDAFRSAFMAHADHAAGGLTARIVRHVDVEDSQGFAAEADDEDADAKPEPAPAVPSVVVLPSLGGGESSTAAKEVARDFKSLAGVALPLVLAPPIAPVRAKLADEFPHLVAQIDVLLANMIEGQPIRTRPIVLVGEPGGGKSRLARRLAELLSVPLARFDAAGSSDNAFGGTPRRWSSGEASQPLLAVRRHKVANPWVQLDELEKAGRSPHNGSLVDALLGFLEAENARAFPDPYLQTEVDLSWVAYVATVNDAALMPAPLRDRFRPVRLPLPRIEHLPQLARAIVDDLAAANPLGAAWTPHLNDGELAMAEDLWRRGGSVRKLVAIVSAIVEGRERRPRN